MCELSTYCGIRRKKQQQPKREELLLRHLREPLCFALIICNFKSMANVEIAHFFSDITTDNLAKQCTSKSMKKKMRPLKIASKT